MNEMYPRSEVDAKAGKVIEECSELIFAISKAKRFGLFNHHPDRPAISNLKEIQEEINDVIQAVALLDDKLTDIYEEQEENT